MVFNDKNMRIMTDIERTKNLKQKANRGREGMARLVERDRDKFEGNSRSPF